MSKGTSTQSVSLPAYQEAQAKELFQAGKSLAGTPFVPYTGPRVAGFNPDQLRQFQATRGMFESSQQYDPLAGLQELAEAPTPTIQPVTGFQGSQIQNIQGPIAAQIGDVQGPQAATIRETPTFGGATIQQIQGPQAAQIGGVSTPQFRGLLDADIGAYQSPYQQQVIDQSMADIQRQADISRGQAQSRAIGAGAFGGSRSALLEGESQRPFIEQMARTSAGLRQAGFEQAQQAAQADLARQQQLGIFGAGQEQQRALQQAQFGQQAGLAGFQAQQQRALEQARLGQQAGLAGQDIAAQRNLQQAQLQQQAGLMGSEQSQQRALEQARLGQQAGLAGYQGRLSTAQRQAELAQQAGLAGQDIQARMAMMQPELELRARQQRAGLLGGISGEQQARLGMLGQIGLQQQGLGQRGLDASYQEFQRALGYGPQQFGLLAAGQGVTTPTTTTQQKTGLGDVLGTAAQLYGLTLLPGSDARMKKDITFVGKEKGHNIYTWNWKDEAKEMGWGNFPTIGVLAQEVKKYMPEAVITDENGYYRVNYGVL